MGCDIHLHTEIKVGGTWHGYGQPTINRNYALFGKMAGVRGDEVPIALPRGLPADASVASLVHSQNCGADGHSHSFLNAQEIVELENWWESEYVHGPFLQSFPEGQWGYFMGNSWGGFHKYPEDRPKGIQDVRFVFWFDN